MPRFPMTRPALALFVGFSLAWALLGCPGFNPNPPHPGAHPAVETDEEPVDSGPSDAEDDGP